MRRIHATGQRLRKQKFHFNISVQVCNLHNLPFINKCNETISIYMTGVNSINMPLAETVQPSTNTMVETGLNNACYCLDDHKTIEGERLHVCEIVVKLHIDPFKYHSNKQMPHGGHLAMSIGKTNSASSASHRENLHSKTFNTVDTRNFYKFSSFP